MAFLQVDYDRAVALAKELETAADKCKDSKTDLMRESEKSALYWVGDSGNALRFQAEQAAKDLEAARIQLMTIAGRIRSVAEELRRKDKELANAIRGGGGGSSW